MIGTVAAVLALLASGGTAHAVSVNVPLPQTPQVPHTPQVPQTPIQVPQTHVTAPGAELSVGPGGVSVNVDPRQVVSQQAVGGAGSALPAAPLAPQPPAPQTAAGAAPQQSGGGSNGRDRISPGLGSRGSRGGAAQSSAGRRTSVTRAVAPGPGSDIPAPKRARTASPPPAERDTVRDAPVRPNVVRQVIERIPQELLAALLVLALFGAAMSLVWLRERGRVRAARRLAQVDPLTGIPNRLAFERRLADEWKRARRYERPLGLLLLDLDGLKTVNDRDGHEAGDRMIQAAARQIAEDIRQSDMAGRLAGDEFVVLCPETPGEGIERLGAKLTSRLDDVGIAASIGGAEIADTDIAPNDLLARADAAMYEEKARRRGSERERSTARPGVAIAG